MDVFIFNIAAVVISVAVIVYMAVLETIDFIRDRRDRKKQREAMQLLRQMTKEADEDV